MRLIDVLVCLELSTEQSVQVRHVLQLGPCSQNRSLSKKLLRDRLCCIILHCTVLYYIVLLTMMAIGILSTLLTMKKKRGLPAIFFLPLLSLHAGSRLLSRLRASVSCARGRSDRGQRWSPLPRPVPCAGDIAGSGQRLNLETH